MRLFRPANIRTRRPFQRVSKAVRCPKPLRHAAISVQSAQPLMLRGSRPAATWCLSTNGAGLDHRRGCRPKARVRCFTRNGHDWADRFPARVDAASRIKAQSFLIDGEGGDRPRRRDARLPCAAGANAGAHDAVLFAFRLGLEGIVSKPCTDASAGLCGDAHRIFTAAQNCSVTAAVSSATSQPFVSAFSLANFCSI